MVRYEETHRRLIATNIKAGVSTAEIVDALNVSDRTVRHYRRNIRIFGVHDPAPFSVQGRPRKIHAAAEEGLRELLTANSTMMLDEIQDWLAEEWKIEVSIPAIYQTMRRLKLSHKKTEVRNVDADEDLRKLWLWRMHTHYRADQLVVVDESAANERTKDRRWGWSEKGVVCRAMQSNIRSGRWSILPAIGINGYLEYEIFHGSFNSERFENFIRKLLRKMNP